MGSRGSSTLQAAYNPSLDGWMLAKQGEDFNVWRNTTSDEELEEYRFVINDAKEFDREKEIFEFRYDSPILVSSRYFKEDTQRQLCSTYYRGTLFLERIPIRLSLIEDLPYPDILHLYHQAFRGFAELHDRMGFFNIEENMICINQEGKVKVWINGELDKSYPEGALLGMHGTERDMVRRIIQLIDQNTDNRTLPENIGALLQQADPPTFRDADILVQNFAARYRTIIPQQIDSVLRREDLLNTTQTVYTNPQQIIHRPISQSQFIQQGANPTLFSTANFGPLTTSIAPLPAVSPTQHSFIQNTQVQNIPQSMTHTFAPQPHYNAQTTTSLYPTTPVTNIAGVLSQPTIPQSTRVIQQVRPLQRQQIVSQHNNTILNQAVQQTFSSPQQTKTAFTQRTSGKPSTGIENAHELSNEQYRNSFNHRMNSKSLTTKNNVEGLRKTEVKVTAENILNQNIHRGPQITNLNKNHSSMYNLGLKSKFGQKAENVVVSERRNVVGQVGVQGVQFPGNMQMQNHIQTQYQNNAQAQHQNQIQSIKTEERRQTQRQVPNDPGLRIVNAKSQIIGFQPPTAPSQSTTQSQFISNPSSRFMQTIQKAQAQYSISNKSIGQAPTQVSSPAKASNNSAFSKIKQNSVGQFKNNLSQAININQTITRNNFSSSAKQVISSIDPAGSSFVGGSTIIAQTAGPVRASGIFRSNNMFSPQIQITYETSRLISGDPQQSSQPSLSSQSIQNQNQMSFGDVTNTATSYQTIVANTRNQEPTVSHLPVTYSVLKETQEFLAKYHHPTQQTNSEIRASLGSQFVLGDDSRNIHDPQRIVLETQDNIQPLQPYQSEYTSYQSEYTSYQPEYTSYQPEYKPIYPIKIDNLTEIGQLKYSLYQQSTSNRDNLRAFTGDSNPPPNPLSSFSNQPAMNYSVAMDSELARDLQKMRNRN